MRLVDFGLADAIGRSTAVSDIVRSERTDTGRDGVLGSVNYMSPEQAMGRPVGEPETSTRRAQRCISR